MFFYAFFGIFQKESRSTYWTTFKTRGNTVTSVVRSMACTFSIVAVGVHRNMGLYIHPPIASSVSHKPQAETAVCWLASVQLCWYRSLWGPVSHEVLLVFRVTKTYIWMPHWCKITEPYHANSINCYRKLTSCKTKKKTLKSNIKWGLHQCMEV